MNNLVFTLHKSDNNAIKKNIFHNIPYKKDKDTLKNIMIFTKKSNRFFHKIYNNFLLYSQTKILHTEIHKFYREHKNHMNTAIFHNNTDLTRHVQFGAIQADFTQVDSDAYEVLLQISSHKFFLHMTGHEWSIDGFEILATKSFLEISKKSIQMMKSLTEQLRQKTQ